MSTHDLDHLQRQRSSVNDAVREVIRWCDDCQTKASRHCLDEHVVRPVSIPVGATYEQARLIAYQQQACPTCGGAGVVDARPNHQEDA